MPNRKRVSFHERLQELQIDNSPPRFGRQTRALDASQDDHFTAENWNYSQDLDSITQNSTIAASASALPRSGSESLDKVRGIVESIKQVEKPTFLTNRSSTGSRRQRIKKVANTFFNELSVGSLDSEYSIASSLNSSADSAYFAQTEVSDINLPIASEGSVKWRNRAEIGKIAEKAYLDLVASASAAEPIVCQEPCQDPPSLYTIRREEKSSRVKMKPNWEAIAQFAASRAARANSFDQLFTRGIRDSTSSTASMQMEISEIRVPIGKEASISHSSSWQA
jgi:hypothetical protein